jgi:hypothetical protein
MNAELTKDKKLFVIAPSFGALVFLNAMEIMQERGNTAFVDGIVFPCPLVLPANQSMPPWWVQQVWIRILRLEMQLNTSSSYLATILNDKKIIGLVGCICNRLLCSINAAGECAKGQGPQIRGHTTPFHDITIPYIKQVFVCE